MRATPHDGTSREYPFTVRKLFRHWTVSFGPWLRWLFCPRLGQNDRFSGSSGTSPFDLLLCRATKSQSIRSFTLAGAAQCCP